jgi:nitroreductase
VVVPAGQRDRLAEVFGQALLDRDPAATAAQIESARAKAHRSPFLMLAIARLTEHPALAAVLPALAGDAGDPEVGDAERLVSLGCAIQNMMLSAHAAGLGSGLTSGQALGSPRLRVLFGLQDNEQAVCCINFGTVTQHRPVRLRPRVSDYVSELGSL